MKILRLCVILGGTAVAAWYGSAFLKASSSQIETVSQTKSEQKLCDFFKNFGWSQEQQTNFLMPLLKRGGIEFSKDQDFTEKINYLINETQAKFRNRQEGQERWESAPATWMANNIQENYDAFQKLGFVDSVVPKEKMSGIVCIMGALKGRMRARLDFAKSLIKKGLIEPVAVVLLSGERFAAKDKDGSQEELEQLAKKIGKASWDKVTEMDILQDLVNSDPFFKNYMCLSMNTPSTVDQNGKICRPTTQSTVETLINDWLNKNSQIKNAFFISNQPYVPYQNAVIQSVFHAKGKTDVNVYTFGEGISNPTPSLESVKTLSEAFASYLWARTPLNLLAMNIKAPKELYSLYSNATFQALLS